MATHPIADEWLDEWSTALRSTVAPSSHTVYLRSVNQFLDHLTKAHPDVTETDQVQRKHVESWLAALAAAGRSQATLSVRLKCLSKFMAYVGDQTDAPNPCDRVARPRVVAPAVAIPSDDTIKMLLAHTDGKTFVQRRDHAMIRVLADSGMRRSELVALDLDDVDLKRQLIVIRRGKGGKARIVAIGPKTAVALSRYLRARRAAVRPDESALFVSVKTKQRLAGGAVELMLKRHCSALGIDPVHPHQLRHAATHALLSAGLGEQVVEHQMGWSGGQMVRRYAASLAAERSQQAIRMAAVGDRL